MENQENALLEEQEIKGLVFGEKQIFNAKLGIEDASHYGQFLHLRVQKMVKEGGCNLLGLYADIEEFFAENKLDKRAGQFEKWEAQADIDLPKIWQSIQDGDVYQMDSIPKTNFAGNVDEVKLEMEDQHAQTKKMVSKIDRSTLQYANILGIRMSYFTIESMAYLDCKSLFDAIFTSPYFQTGKLVEMGVDFMDEKNIEYFSLGKINDLILDYKIQKATYESKPQRYAAFVEFIKLGGCNNLAAMMGIETNFENKDLSNILPQQQKEIEPQEQQDQSEEVEQQAQSQPSETELMMDALEKMQADNHQNFQNLALEISAMKKVNSAQKEETAYLIANINKIAEVQGQQ